VRYGFPAHVQKLQAGDAAKIAVDGEFWRAVAKYEPLLRLINTVVTFLKGGTVPLSRVALSCVLIIESVGLNESVASAVKDAISKSVASVASNAHALAVLLCPAVSLDRLAAVRELLSCAGNR
jgi:hypothetical protein